MVFCHFSFVGFSGRERPRHPVVNGRDRPPKWLHGVCFAIAAAGSLAQLASQSRQRSSG
jgi:hypothetical protein